MSEAIDKPFPLGSLIENTSRTKQGAMASFVNVHFQISWADGEEPAVCMDVRVHSGGIGTRYKRDLHVTAAQKVDLRT